MTSELCCCVAELTDLEQAPLGAEDRDVSIIATATPGHFGPNSIGKRLQLAPQAHALEPTLAEEL